MAQEMAQGLKLHPEDFKDFLKHLEANGRAPATLQRYTHDLQTLYQWLPQEKVLTTKALAGWKDSMEQAGYSRETVTSRIAAANSFLTFMGRRDLQLLGIREKPKPADPGETEPGDVLQRGDYLKLLRAAAETGNRKLYLIIKVMATTGLSVKWLPVLTVEAVRKGCVETDDEKIPLPESLREELMDFGKGIGVKRGPLFLARSGEPIHRTTVTCAMKTLAARAGVPADQVSPRSLRKMYQATRSGIFDGLLRQAELEYQRLLAEEEDQIHWYEDSGNCTAEPDR